MKDVMRRLIYIYIYYKGTEKKRITQNRKKKIQFYIKPKVLLYLKIDKILDPNNKVFCLHTLHKNDLCIEKKKSYDIKFY